MLRGLLLHVDADQPHGKPALCGQVAVGGEGQVAVATAQVDDPQRVAGAGLRSCLPSASVIDASRIRTNSSTWRYFACRLGLIRPSASASPSAASTGSSSGSSRSFSRSCAPHGLDRRGPAAVVGDGVELLGHPQLVDLGRGLDVPVAERLRQQRIDRGTGRLPDQVVGGEGLGGVVGRDLQVRPRLQVHPPQLSAPPLRLSVGRLPALLPTRRQPAHQGVRVEQVGADPGEAVGERLGRGAHFQDGRHDDDHQQCRQRDRDDESAVAGVHLVNLPTEQLRQMQRLHLRQVVELKGARQAVGEDHGLGVGRERRPHRRQQVGLGHIYVTSTSNSYLLCRIPGITNYQDGIVVLYLYTKFTFCIRSGISISVFHVDAGTRQRLSSLISNNTGNSFSIYIFLPQIELRSFSMHITLPALQQCYNLSPMV